MTTDGLPDTLRGITIEDTLVFSFIGDSGATWKMKISAHTIWCSCPSYPMRQGRCKHVIRAEAWLKRNDITVVDLDPFRGLVP